MLVTTISKRRRTHKHHVIKVPQVPQTLRLAWHFNTQGGVVVGGVDLAGRGEHGVRVLAPEQRGWVDSPFSNTLNLDKQAAGTVKIKRTHQALSMLCPDGTR
eukprot:238681-Pelagomonas_calceolata.AAC.1